MIVSVNIGTQYRPPHAIILCLGTPSRVPPTNFARPPYCHGSDAFSHNLGSDAEPMLTCSLLRSSHNKFSSHNLMITGLTGCFPYRSANMHIRSTILFSFPSRHSQITNPEGSKYLKIFVMNQDLYYNCSSSNSKSQSEVWKPVSSCVYISEGPTIPPWSTHL